MTRSFSDRYRVRLYVPATIKLRCQRRMKPVKNVDEYITTARKDVQPKLRELRAAIKDVAPDAVESISYGMPFYSYKGEEGFKGRLVYFGLLKSKIARTCARRTSRVTRRRINTSQQNRLFSSRLIKRSPLHWLRSWSGKRSRGIMPRNSNCLAANLILKRRQFPQSFPFDALTTFSRSTMFL